MVTGSVANTNEQSEVVSIGKAFLPVITPVDLTLIDHEKWHLPQASSFFSAKHLDMVGRFVREDLHYTMDRELIYRIVKSGRIVVLNDTLASYRHHLSSKTTSEILKSFEESQKSFSYCDWGDFKVRKQRQKVLRWRLAQGYKANASNSSSLIQIFHYYLKAAIYRPSYIFQKRFHKSYLSKLRRLWLLRKASH